MNSDVYGALRASMMFQRTNPERGAPIRALASLVALPDDSVLHSLRQLLLEHGEETETTYEEHCALYGEEPNTVALRTLARGSWQYAAAALASSVGHDTVTDALLRGVQHTSPGEQKYELLRYLAGLEDSADVIRDAVYIFEQYGSIPMSKAMAQHFRYNVALPGSCHSLMHFSALLYPKKEEIFFALLRDGAEPLDAYRMSKLID